MCLQQISWRLNQKHINYTTMNKLYPCIVPHPDLHSSFRLHVEVMCVVQSLVQGPLQVNEKRQPHCGEGDETRVWTELIPHEDNDAGNTPKLRKTSLAWMDGHILMMKGTET